jgi:hypothetical protein
MAFYCLLLHPLESNLRLLNRKLLEFPAPDTKPDKIIAKESIFAIPPTTWWSCDREFNGECGRKWTACLKKEMDNAHTNKTSG